MNLTEICVGDFLKRVRNPVSIEQNEEYSLVTIKMNHKGVILRGKKMGSAIGSKTMHRVRAGQFILSGIDARHGAFGIIPDELDGAVVTNDFWYFELDESLIDTSYFYHLTSTDWFVDLCKKASDGTTNRVRLQKDKFYSQKLLLPDVEIQRLLISRHEENLPLFNSLKGELKDQTVSLAKLRSAILREAVQGKLVPQDSSEGNAQDLLDQIRKERERSIDGKKSKKSEIKPIDPSDFPFKIPENWAWCHLGNFVKNFDGNRKPVSKNERLGKDKTYPYYGASGVIDEIDGYTHDGDFLLIGEDGANLISKSTPIAFLTSGKIWVNNHAHVLGTYHPTSREYLCYFLNIVDLRSYITGGFQPKLSQGKLNEILLPVPPIEEQIRIVRKINELMEKLKGIETSIVESKNLSERLLKVGLKEVFNT